MIHILLFLGDGSTDVVVLNFNLDKDKSDQQNNGFLYYLFF